MANQWLHTGSLVCPSCQDVCGDEFAARGEECRIGVLPPSNYVYHEDTLTCGAASNVPKGVIITPLLLLSVVIAKLVIATSS